MKYIYLSLCTVALYPATVRIYNKTSQPIKAEIVNTNNVTSSSKTIEVNDYRLFDSSLRGIKKINIYEDSGKRTQRGCALGKDGKVVPGYIPLKTMNLYQIPVDLSWWETEKSLYYKSQGTYSSESMGSGTASIEATTHEEAGDCQV